MKILYINNCHYRRGGADVVYLNTGELFEKMGHEVYYFSTVSAKNEDSNSSEYFVKDVDALHVGFLKQLFYTPRKLYSPASAKNLAGLLKKTKPQVAHIHLYKGGLTASILPVLKKHKIPTVITLHDYSLLCPRNIFLDGNGNLCEKCLTLTTLNCVINRCNRKNLFYSTINYLEFELNNSLMHSEDYFDRIICVSKFNFNKHLSRKNLVSHLRHLYNFFPKLSEAIPDHRKGDYFIYFGRLSKEKGILSLLKAWKLVDKDLRLLVVGEGTMQNEIVSEINNSGLANVELLGYKTGIELKELILKSSFVLVPSEWYENNPMTIIEGYALGKPAIGSNIGGIPELISENETGYLFESGNIAQLAAKIILASQISDEEYKKMSVNARQFANTNFDEMEHYKNLLKIYEEASN